MDYNNVYCIKDVIDGNPCRLVLGKNGQNPLIVIGLNPSIADNNKSDATMRKILGFMTKWNEDGSFYHDSFIMLNLYPLIETYSGKLKGHDFNEIIHSRNLEAISSILNKHPSADVLLCYGDAIEDVPKLKECRNSILSKLGEYPNLNLYKLGELTIKRNPRHPSRLAYKTEVGTFVNLHSKDLKK